MTLHSEKSRLGRGPSAPRCTCTKGARSAALPTPPAVSLAAYLRSCGWTGASASTSGGAPWQDEDYRRIAFRASLRRRRRRPPHGARASL